MMAEGPDAVQEQIKKEPEKAQMLMKLQKLLSDAGMVPPNP